MILDLDGVLIDFHSNAMARNLAFLKHESDFPSACGWDFVAAVNTVRQRVYGDAKRVLTDKEVWEVFDYEFWLTLPLYPMAPPFLCWLEEQATVYFCTSRPDSDCRGFLEGRYQWCVEHIPSRLSKVFIGTEKEAFAPDAILIDDRDLNCERFIEAGGQAILFPRPWNARGYCKHPYNVVIDELKEIWNETS